MTLKMKYRDPLGNGGGGYKLLHKAPKYDAPPEGTRVYTVGKKIPARPRTGNTHGKTPKRPAGVGKLCRRTAKSIGWPDGSRELKIWQR